MTRRLVASLAAASALAGACGGGGEGYAADVCSALDRWVGSVNGSLQELREGAEDRTTIAQERRAVLRHLEDVEAANAALRKDLQATAAEGGSPEADLTSRLVGLVEEADRQAARIRTEVQDLEADDLQAFREAAGPLLGRGLGGVIRRVLGTPTEADPALAEEFDAEPACDGVLLEGGPQEGPA